MLFCARYSKIHTFYFLKIFFFISGILTIVCALSDDSKTDTTDADSVDDTSLKPDDGSDGKTELSAQSKRRVFGSVLGRGFSFGKRLKPDQSFQSATFPDAVSDTIVDDIDRVDANGFLDDKRWAIPDVYFNQKRSKRDTVSDDKRFITYFGNMLGRGFSLGKRDGEEDSDLQDMEPNFVATDDADVDKRWYNGVLGRGFALGKRRYFGSGGRRSYFGSVLGRGFSFGKRDSGSDTEADEESGEDDSLDIDKIDNMIRGDVDDQRDKRYIYSSPGYRFMFGKRSGSEMEKRYGYLFGRPFSSGRKRFHFHPRVPYGFVLGSGFSLGKRSNGEGDNGFEGDLSDDAGVNFEKRSYLLGKGYMFGKRGNKRYGWVLGSGLKFGKRSQDDLEEMRIENEPVYFVDEDGLVYIVKDDDVKPIDTFDEETFDPDLDDSPAEGPEIPVKRSFGLILGKGYGFGKRARFPKRYGHILGGGFSFGK